MSTTVDAMQIKLAQASAARLRALAEKLAMTPAETAALLVEEGLRREAFPGVDFRTTIIGRQVYIRGTRLPIWMVAQVAEHFDGDAARVADHYGSVRADEVAAALAYARAYPDEIAAFIAANDAAFERYSAGVPDTHNALP